MTDVRKNTSAILELMDAGILNPRAVAGICLEWLSEAEVTEMLEKNDMMVFVETLEDFEV